jgi:hypothetical protein
MRKQTVTCRDKRVGAGAERQGRRRSREEFGVVRSDWVGLRLSEAK